MQVALARSVGIQITEASLGALADEAGGDGSMASTMKASKDRGTSIQDERENVSGQDLSYPPQSAQQQMYAQQGYSQGYQHDAGRFNDFQSKSAQNAAQYEPEHMRRMYDSATKEAGHTAALAKARNQSSFTFG